MGDVGPLIVPAACFAAGLLAGICLTVALVVRWLSQR
jgi:hypothetical protein